MSAPPTGVFDRIWWRQDPDDPDRVAFRALDAYPARGAEGDPMITLMAMDAVGILTLSAVWQPPAEKLEALRKELAERLSLSRDAVRLAPAPVRSCQAVLELETDGEHRVLSRATISDSPPYPAAFRATVRNHDLDRVRAAVDGEKDVLRVRYTAEARELARATARLSGQIRPEGASPPETADEALRLVEAGLRDGGLSMTVQADPAAPLELRERARDAAASRAAEAVRRMAARGWPPEVDAGLNAEGSLTEEVTSPLEATSDVAEWLEAGERKSHLIESGTEP